jgi:hypothetical protein
MTSRIIIRVEARGMRQERRPRIDRKHRFPLRIDEVAHNEADALAFRHNVSMNVLYCEAILWALASDEFRRHLQERFPRDTRRGYFTYNVDMTTARIGRRV